MEDREIVALYWSRDERAIEESAGKYGGVIRALTMNILGNGEDAEECLNDTWLRVWNAIPPERPANLKLFLTRIARNLAIDRYRKASAQKRGGGEMERILDELSAAVPDAGVEVEKRELAECVNRFVRRLPVREGNILLRRYFYGEPVFEIAARYGMTSNAVSVSLSRSRRKLREYLKKEGFHE